MTEPARCTQPSRPDREIARSSGTRTQASTLLVSVLVLVAAACSDDEPAAPEATPAETAPPSSTVPIETAPSEPATTAPADDEDDAPAIPVPSFPVPSIPLVGADDDPSAQAAFAVVELAFAAHNAGDMETWTFWREQGRGLVDWFAYDAAIEARLDVAQCAYRGLGEWDWEEPIRGHGFDCDTTLTDVFLRPAGVEMAGTYNWVVAEDLTWAVGGDNADPEFMAQVMQDYRDWLKVAHPDVESTITWAPRFPRFPAGFPTPDSIPAAVEYIDEFVADSDVYPLTSPVPPRAEWVGELVQVLAVTDGSGRDGDVRGVRVWQLIDAPDGSKPDQAWLSVGSDPDGNIYVSGHDHETNSMLYRLEPPSGDIEWVGDARTASTEADNWETGETAEKFHTRPTHHDGRMYVATLDSSSIDGNYWATRGFHWYAYDLTSGDFVDLSADEPDGIGAKHLQVVTITADPDNDRIYGMSLPDNQLLYYDLSEGTTTVIGSPDGWEGYFYSNRFMWTDSRGRVYITGGTERSQWNQGEDPAVLDSVWRYTPDTGFEDTGFALQTMAAIEVGQWNAAHDTLYVSDDMGHIYRFTDTATPTWEYVGRPDFPAGETTSGNNKVWVFQLDPDETTIYLGRSDNFGEPNEIWEFDIDTGTSSILATLPDLDATAGSEDFITGYDSWDDDGNFYITSFSMYDFENTYLIGINPEQIRASPPD